MALEEHIVAYAHTNKLRASKRKAMKLLNIYKRNITLSVWIEPCKLFPSGLGIDAMSQSTTGSGADKIPFKILNITNCWEFPGVLVLDGDGREMIKARNWAREQVTGTNNLRAVLTLAEFEQWLKQTIATAQPIDRIMPTRTQTIANPGDTTQTQLSIV